MDHLRPRASASNMAMSTTTSSSSLFEANEFQSGVWRTSSTDVHEHTDVADAGALARALSTTLAKQAQWRFALGRSTSSIVELRDRMRPFLVHELVHIMKQGPNDATVLSSAGGNCVAVWRRQRRGGLRIAKDLLKWWPVGDALHALRFLNALEASHPKEPHVYLEALGTMTGSNADEVMEEMTARLDREGTHAYAECVAGEDVGFFLSHGFRVYNRQIPNLPRGAPHLMGMWRTPKDERRREVLANPIDDSIAESDAKRVRRKPRAAIDEDRRTTV